MEDEDYFEFSDDILIASTEKLQFRDTAIYINSSTDGQLDLVADTEIQIAATTIDINGNADVSGTLTYGSLSDGAITITAFVDEDNMASNSATLVPTQQSVKAYVDTQLTAEDLDFQADSGGALSIDLDSETLTFTGGTGIDTSGSGNAVTFAIDSTVTTLTGSQTLTNKTLTSAVLNGTISGTSIKDEDDMTSNSASHLATQQSIKAYVDGQITAEDLDFQADSGGALSIDLDSETLTFTGGTGIDTSGSGNAVTFAIDSTVTTLSGTQTLTNKTLTSPKINEDVALTSTATELNLLDGVSGLVQADFTKLAAVDSTSDELNLVDGSSAGTIVNSKAVIYGSSGEVNATTLQIAGSSITSTAAELNLLDGVSGLVQADFTKLAAVDATAAELNIMDGGTSASGTTLVDADRLVANDDGTMKQVALTDVKTYLTSAGFTSDDPTALAIALG